MRGFVLDVLRRHLWGTVTLTVMLAGMWVAAGFLADEEADLAPMAFAMSLGWANLLGSSRIQFIPRAVWHLPISRRDIGRARWFVATVLAVGITTAAKLIAMLFPAVRASFSWSSVLLSSVYDFAFAGIGYAVVIAATQRPPERGQWRAVRETVKSVAEGLGPLMMSLPMLLATVSGGRLIRLWLPTHWSDLSSPGSAVLALALGAAIATYFHTPGPPLFARQLPPGRHDPPPAAMSIPHGGLSGWPHLLVRESVWTLAIGGALMTVPILGLRALGITGPVREALAMFAIFIASLCNRFPDVLAHLRVLPVSVRQVNALLLLWPAAVWLVGWTCLIALPRLIAGHGIGSVRADVFIGVVGLSAIVQAMIVRLSSLSRLFFLATTSGLVPLLPLVSPPDPRAVVIFGFASLVAAAMLNHATLRSSSTYHGRIGPVLTPLP